MKKDKPKKVVKTTAIDTNRNNPFRRKVTLEIAREIRRRFLTEDKTQGALGEEYGITAAAVGYILRNISHREPDLE